jgi:hypothetical protein
MGGSPSFFRCDLQYSGVIFRSRWPVASSHSRLRRHASGGAIRSSKVVRTRLPWLRCPPMGAALGHAAGQEETLEVRAGAGQRLQFSTQISARWQANGWRQFASSALQGCPGSPGKGGGRRYLTVALPGHPVARSAGTRAPWPVEPQEHVVAASGHGLHPVRFVAGRRLRSEPEGGAAMGVLLESGTVAVQ